jgi:hypothetical protein
MRKTACFLLVPMLLLCAKINAQAVGKWTYLFDGKSVAQLRGYKMAGFPTDAWKVENGALETNPDVANIDLVSKNIYTDFDLTFEWKVSKAGNSGVFYNVEETSTVRTGWIILRCSCWMTSILTIKNQNVLPVLCTI